MYVQGDLKLVQDAVLEAVLADHDHGLETVRQAAQMTFLRVGECHGASTT